MSPDSNNSSQAAGGVAGGAGGGAVGIGMIVAMPFILMSSLWFYVGSWQLSLLLDQVKCHKGQLWMLIANGYK